ncbi:ethanolamine utilization protein EutH [Serratia nevei]|uniref:ethanolamine utilization protein EutH n=1 Tax=Serratia nevei TaxID=2703794 RepID=UPI0037DC4657
MAEFGNFIIYIIMAGTLIGALASIVKPEGELGREFVNGIHAIGPVFLAQAGIMAAIPIISYLIMYSIGPFFSALGSDASIAALAVIAVDMGGLSAGRRHRRQPRHVDRRHAGGLHLRRQHRVPDPRRAYHAEPRRP